MDEIKQIEWELEYEIEEMLEMDMTPGGLDKTEQKVYEQLNKSIIEKQKKYARLILQINDINRRYAQGVAAISFLDDVIPLFFGTAIGVVVGVAAYNLLI